MPRYTEAGDLNLLIAGERMRIFLSLPSKSKAPASVSIGPSGNFRRVVDMKTTFTQ